MRTKGNRAEPAHRFREDGTQAQRTDGVRALLPWAATRVSPKAILRKPCVALKLLPSSLPRSIVSSGLPIQCARILLPWRLSYAVLLSAVPFWNRIIDSLPSRKYSGVSLSRLRLELQDGRNRSDAPRSAKCPQKRSLHCTSRPTHLTRDTGPPKSCRAWAGISVRCSRLGNSTSSAIVCAGR